MFGRCLLGRCLNGWIAFLLLGLMPVFVVAAESESEDVKTVLQRLPFGVRMGQTHMNDILKRGNCAVAPEFQSQNGCLRFDMAGRFEVHLSAAGFVNKVVFSNHLGHTLPRNWRHLGLTLGIEGRQRGTEYETFRTLVKGVENMRVVTEGSDDITLRFELGPNLYEAKFWKADSNARPDRDRETWLWRAGLYRLEVLENF